jgi:predicted nucleotide-binding protein
VTILKDPAVEDPSDLSGIVYIPLDRDWRIELGRELRASGIPVDMSRAP